jgi:hypothetical protein
MALFHSFERRRWEMTGSPAVFEVRGEERKQTILHEFADGRILMLKYE